MLRFFLLQLNEPNYIQTFFLVHFSTFILVINQLDAQFVLQ
jgi:hypothetical protein